MFPLQACKPQYCDSPRLPRWHGIRITQGTGLPVVWRQGSILLSLATSYHLPNQWQFSVKNMELFSNTASTNPKKIFPGLQEGKWSFSVWPLLATTSRTNRKWLGQDGSDLLFPNTDSINPKRFLLQACKPAHTIAATWRMPQCTLESQGTGLPVVWRQGSILLSLAISGHLANRWQFSVKNMEVTLLVRVFPTQNLPIQRDFPCCKLASLLMLLLRPPCECHNHLGLGITRNGPSRRLTARIDPSQSGYSDHLANQWQFSEKKIPNTESSITEISCASLLTYSIATTMRMLPWRPPREAIG